MSKVELYIEGGGDSKAQKIQCRKGFTQLLRKCGFAGHMPSSHLGGGRKQAFDQFKCAVECAGDEEYPILLVDSEDVVVAQSTWQHLHERDGWSIPRDVGEDQAQLMVTCMETWIMADPGAIRGFFGKGINNNSLISQVDLEARDRHQIQKALFSATKNCQKKYKKGDRSFELLGTLDPEVLKLYLPHFRKFISTLMSICNR